MYLFEIESTKNYIKKYFRETVSTIFYTAIDHLILYCGNHKEILYKSKTQRE